MIYLDELLEGVEIISASDDLHVEVSGFHMDSRKIKPGYCFVAIRGYKENGLQYLGDAILNGAKAIVFETSPDDTLPEIPVTATWVQVENARVALSRMAATLYGYDSFAASMYAIGVTGTNGKTTVINLIHAIFNREIKTAKIGTLGMAFEKDQVKTSLTTPESIDIFEFLAAAHKQGCKAMVMETSSVALKVHRVAHLHFSQGIFTNFSGDHLDFHQTMEDYLDSKLILFKNLTMENWAIINIDDPSAIKIIEQLNCKYLTYGFSKDADVRPMKYKLTLDGIQATLDTPRGKINIKSALLGRVNLANIMAAVSSAVIKGISLENIAAAVQDFKPVKGRLDRAYSGDFSVLIDYAHTDKALEGMLQSLKEIATNRIILVFGAGGSRDKTKRPRMGNVACQYADFVVVTSDNPRKEDPQAIIQDILQGFAQDFKAYIVEIDREKAIEKALDMAQPGDLVVIAGKGHEDYQIFKDKTIHFDDYEMVKTILDKKRKGSCQD